MSIVLWIRTRVPLILLAVRSGIGGSGPRRADHPFCAGLRPGQVVPHQGGHWPNTAPNTIDAYRRAAPRSQILDVDVWLTADEILVCNHDDEIEPGRSISASTWAELEATTDVPRFSDVASTFPDHRLNIEIKDARAVRPIRELMADQDLATRSCLSAFSPFLARVLAGAVPHAAHARPTARRAGRVWGRGDVVQTMTFVPDAGSGLGALQPMILRRLFTAGSPELVMRQMPIARAKSIPIFAWTVNDEAPLRQLIDAGIDAVLSDDPQLFDESEERA